MAVYQIKQKQVLPISLEQTWTFFTNPNNLAKLTPEKVQFKHLIEPDADQVYAGMLLVYSLAPIAGIPIKWVTEITQVQPMRRFVDDQKQGPFGMWHHIHEFREVEEGTEISDNLYYKMPLGILGTAAHALFVKKQVGEIFAYREKALAELFLH